MIMIKMIRMERRRMMVGMGVMTRHCHPQGDHRQICLMPQPSITPIYRSAL
jgi:hypothetical protein